MLLPDPALFKSTTVPEETRRFNETLIEKQASGPDIWDWPVEVVRQTRRDGKGIFPLEPYLPDSEVIFIPSIENSKHQIPLRIIRPDDQKPRGVFLHIHGGGWVFGAADLQDRRLKQLANATGLDCVSVEYRLAPEHPYPAPCDDCETAALWLATKGHEKFNTSFLAIGGESAGGHLAANALLRLRDRHRQTPYQAAVFIAAIFDLGMTPSAANFDQNLVLRHKDMVNFSAALLQDEEDRRDPDVSPLYAKLDGMPAAHFTVGTADALLDDTLFMANHWIKSQADTELEIYPGGCHVFQYFDELEQSKQSRASMARFLNRQVDLI